MRKLRIFFIIIIIILILLFFNRLLEPKYATSLVEGSMISQYYNESKDHEVIFIGDCEVYANFSPMVMYERQGIKSYIRGSSQQLIWQSYYILEETLKYETPKVVVYNVNAMRYSEPVSEAYNRLTIDYMKWSKQKVNIIKASMTKEENMLYYVFPLLRYHSRFDELSLEDINYFWHGKSNTFNGFLVNKNVKPVESLPTQKPLGNYKFADICYDYLNKITKLCKEHNIKLVLIKAPSLYPYWYDEYDKQIAEYAENNNIDYYNLKNYTSEIGIDFSTDTYDAGLHLNLNGATKLSNFFADLLVENYDLTNFKNDSLYEKKLIEYKNFIQ